MNWSDFIGPAAGAIVGAVGAYFALDKRQAVSEARLTEKISALEKASERAITDVKAEHMRSADSQGKRVGDVETLVGGLIKFQARYEGAEHERDMSGVVRNR